MSSADARHRAIAQHSRQADQFAARYEHLDGDPYASCFAYSRRRLEEVLARELPVHSSGLRLLDAGCGPGHQLAQLRKRGFVVAGLDGSSEMLGHARANNPGVPIECADVESMPFPSATFDVAICIEVLRYLPDIRACLGEMARVLRPGGICLATATPRLNLNGYWLLNRLASTIGVRGLLPLRQYFTTAPRLRRDFVEAGFTMLSVRGVYLGPVNWVERLAPGLLPRVLRAWEPIDARLAHRKILREFSNMFLVRAVRRGQNG